MFSKYSTIWSPISYKFKKNNMILLLIIFFLLDFVSHMLAILKRSNFWVLFRLRQLYITGKRNDRRSISLPNIISSLMPLCNIDHLSRYLCTSFLRHTKKTHNKFFKFFLLIFFLLKYESYLCLAGSRRNATGSPLLVFWNQCVLY